MISEEKGDKTEAKGKLNQNRTKSYLSAITTVIFLFNELFQRSFQFTTKLRGKYRGFPSAPCAYAGTRAMHLLQLTNPH